MADVRATADTAIATFLPTLATKQAAYLTRTGGRTYWQGLETHVTTPTGGTSTAPTLTRKPTDQAESWADEGYSIPSRSFSFAVNVYNGPSGHGYELTCQFKDAGGTWRRVVNVGLETYREQPWTFALDRVE